MNRKFTSPPVVAYVIWALLLLILAWEAWHAGYPANASPLSPDILRTGVW